MTVNPRKASLGGVVAAMSAVRSIQVNGRCLTGQGGHPEATVDRTSAPAVQAYGGTVCQSGTRVAASTRWGDPDAQGCRRVRIS